MSDSDDDGFLEDQEYYRTFTKWAIIINPKNGNWMIGKVQPETEVGEDPYDMFNEQEYRIAAFFGEEVERILEALEVLGDGSLESNSLIEDLLSGVCRSFVEALAKSEEWGKSENPHGV